jgi:hypothetical protein
MKIFLASALLSISGLACAQNRVGPQDAPRKNICPSCLAKSFVGHLAPDFELPTLDGRKLRLSDLRGQAVLLNSAEDVSDYAREMNVNYPIVIGNISSFEKRYDGVIFLPMTFFLDREGKVVALEIGVQSRSVYVEHIGRSFDQDPVAQSRK